MKTRILSSLTLVAAALFALTPLIKADTYDWSYTGAGINAAGMFTTGGPLSNDVGGFGLDGYAITDFTGQRNGVAISGLVTVPGSPNVATVGGFYVDNALVINPSDQFDWNGILFGTMDGLTWNIASTSSPTGGGYTEYTGDSSSNYTGGASSINVNIARHVPDGGTTALLLATGMIGLIAFKHKSKHLGNIASLTAAC